jgi:hypothetical protein
VEFVLIIVGVLVAFQVEDYRERAELAAREVAQLEALRADFADNESRLRRTIGQQRDIIRAHHDLMEIAHGLSPAPSGDSVEFLASRSYEFRRLEPVTGAYDALVSSGDLRLVSNPALRSRLATFFGELGDGHEDEELSTLVRTNLLASIGQSTDILSILRPSWSQQIGFDESPLEPDLESLLGNSEFLSHLAILSMIEANVTGYYVRLLAMAEEVVGALDDELESRAL